MLRGIILSLFALSIMGVRLSATASPTLRVSGGPLIESLPFLILAHDKNFANAEFKVVFIPWHSPDQFRALIAGNQVDGAVITTTTASILYNRGIPVKTAILYEAPLWIVSSKRNQPRSLKDITGTIVFPFGPREMPQLLFQALNEDSGSNPTSRHTGSALEAVNLLLLGKGNHTLISEPAATIAVRRSLETPSESRPELIKSIDVNALWQKKYNGRRLTVSCFAVFGKTTDRTDLINKLVHHYRRAVLWARENPEKATAVVKDNFPALWAQARQGGLSAKNISMIVDDRVAADAVFFLEKIADQSPASIGGSVPDASFFMAVQ